jgi:outer membrane biosynthesis protein TonB
MSETRKASLFTEDRVFTVAFTGSLAIHLVLLIGPFLPLPWFSVMQVRTPLEVIYEYEIAQQELRSLEQQLERAKRDAITTPSPTGPTKPAQIRIPDRPSLATADLLPDTLSSRYASSSAVDLTNLAEAAQGDPILLSYFSAIREQIQRTANHREWMTGDAREGLIYITFILTSAGGLQEISVVADRSTPSPDLREIALHIVKAAAPFPAFPPSIDEATKTIIVPLEFLLGS